MNSIIVNTTSQSYPIYIEKDFSNLKQAIEDIGKTYTSYVIITDDNVYKDYAHPLEEILESFNKPVLTISFEAGEQNKNLSTISMFYEKMIAFQADRKTLVVALGGGVTGDMAGFTAATYMRGVDFVQVPTSLLAQVDSSVGGKTGIDFNGYKNIVGAFYQPMFVFINVSTLKTLPSREFYSGMGEVVKHGFIKDVDYHTYLKEHVNSILALEEEVLVKMIKWSCQIKKSVVDEDEKEQGARALLNFGHTIGHSIERLKEFQLIHGECVGIGMHGELLLSHKLGYLSSDEFDEALQLIEAFHMPLMVSDLDAETIYQEMFHDKKTSNKRLVFALIDRIGNSFLNTDTINKDMIMQSINEIISL